MDDFARPGAVHGLPKWTRHLHLFIIHAMETPFDELGDVLLHAKPTAVRGKVTTSRIGTTGRAAASGVEGAMAVPYRWCCLEFVHMLLSFVPVLLYTAVAASIKYNRFFPGTCVRARTRVPSPSPPCASIGPEPEPLIRRWTIHYHSADFFANPSTHPVAEHLMVQQR